MRHRGLSLIEVVIVVGVIALLMSILVPVVGRARDECNLVLCKSNLRSLGRGCILYAGDNNSAFPVDRKVDNPHLGLVEMLGEGEYIESKKLYYCPSETQDQFSLSDENFEAGNIGYFYFSFTDRPANRYLSNFLLKSVEWPRRLTISMPSDTWVSSDQWFSNMPTSHRWYPKGINYVTIDTSVHMIKGQPRRHFR
jgi:prepilin-type N-terminal cleavage/methylation domain-containing protein